MSKAPPRIIAGLLRFQFNPSRNPINPNLLPKLPQIRGFTSILTSPNGFPKFGGNGFSTWKLNSATSFGRFSLMKYGSPVPKLGSVSCKKLEFNPLGIRCFSRAMQKPVSRTMATSSLSRNREEAEGFLKRNYLFLLWSGAAAFHCILLSTIMVGIADAFGELAKGMAVAVLAFSRIPMAGFVALSFPMVAFAAFAEMLCFGASLALFCCLAVVLAIVLETF